MTLVTEKQAAAAGYRALTTAYRMPEERAMLLAVLADMERGGIAHVLVQKKNKLTVWRAGCGFLGGHGKAPVVPRRERSQRRRAEARRKCRSKSRKRGR